MVTLRPFTPDDTDWLVDRHGALYAEEEGFDETFPLLVREILGDFLAQQVPGRDQGWIAWDGDARVGSIFVVEEDTQTAKLRLVLLEPAARGTGLAQRMLETALDFARAAGYRRIRLWTHESHVAAGRLYARNQFRLIESEAKRSFGQDVVAQIWERDL
ncbi:MAG: GNAT family N-acetyltransferase [Rhodobacter sp.]|nr:GNAT family N-acetyltransferase [Paracoccaceae bacterium]MCB1411022.1 GNAT family N-acetyltransferase [Paracoccaceae bacterium]MCC0079106.1 GNAT family N-acetyltransferase [Rhodobacter sp.]